MNALKILKTFNVFLLLSTLVFTSCNMAFNEPVKEFLKEYTETAAIVSHELDKTDYPEDKNGFTSVPSSDDVLVTYTMRNPQNYLLDFGLSFEDNNSKSVAEKFGKSAYSFTQTDDFVQVVLKYGQEYLYAMECGGNLSGDVSLLEPKSGRSFEPYNYKLKVNSVPEPVRNLVVLQDSADNKYVLAMNMPDMSGIHKDIRTLKIDNVEYAVELSANPSASEVGINTSKYTQFRNTYAPSWVAGALGVQFEGAADQRVLYFKTNTPISTEEIFFDVVLLDSEGLAVESKISEKSKKLNKVVYSSGYESLETNDDGYATFTITAPAQATDGSAVDGDISVYYKIYAYDESAPDHKGSVRKQGVGNNSVTVTLTNGKWICESWSHKVGYIDSTVNEAATAVQGFVFVQPSYSGAVKDGGKATPYTSIESAIANVSGFEVVKIFLLENVSVSSPLTLSKNVEIKSDSGYKVSGKIIIPDGFELVINEKAYFDYLIVNEGGLIRTRGIPAGTDSIASVEYVAAVAGTSIEGVEIIKSADSNALTEALIDRFLFKNAGYFIELKNGNGVITIAGVKLDVQTILGNYTVTVTGFNAGSNYYMPKNAKLTVTEIKDSNGEEVSLSCVTAMNIYVQGTLVQTNSAQAKKTELTIGNYEFYGNSYSYVLEVCFTIGGLPVSAQIRFEFS